MTMKHSKAIAALLLVLCLIVGMLPQTVFATEGATIGTSGLCEHHAAHDETCGYVEGTAESVCTCETLCTEDTINADCAVCSAEDADMAACTGASTKAITGWSWIETEGFEEMIDPETNTLPLVGVSERSPVDLETLLAVLPASITAAIGETEETVTLSGWSCADFPTEGAGSGNFLFTAALPEGYTLAEDAPELAVTVELGGAATLTTGYTAALTFLADGGIRIQVSGNSRSDDQTYTKEEFFIAGKKTYNFVVGTSGEGNIYDELLTWTGDSSELLLGSDISSMEGGLSWSITIEDGADTSVIQSLQICERNTITSVTGSLGCSVSNKGTITNGTFDGEKVENEQGGQITGGTFNGKLINLGSITGGVFNSQVENNKTPNTNIAGSITGGTFNHLVINASGIDNTNKNVRFGPHAVYVSNGGTVTGDLVDSAGNAVDPEDTYAITYSWRGYADATLSGFSTYKTGQKVPLPEAKDLAGLFGVPEAAVNDGWYCWNEVFNGDGSPKPDNIYEQLQLQGKAMTNTLDTAGKSGVLRLWCRWQYPLTVKNGQITHVNNTAVESGTAPVTSGTYFEGDVIRIAADSSGEGRVFLGWTDQNGDAFFFVNASAADTTFPMEARNITVTAVFHTHTYAWKYDETHHYELCSGEDCPDTDKEKPATSPHAFDNASDARCDTCGYTRTITPGHTHSGGYHSFSSDVITIEAPKTFDSGISLYVSMSVLALTGSAMVIGKKRKEKK